MTGESNDDLERLRELLIAKEATKLDELEDRVVDPEARARDTSAVLAQAIRLRGEDDEELREALTPTIETALEASVRSNPDRLVDAIFPIMGPAIRRSIASALREFMESFNEVVESSFTPRGLRWRLESRRTGRPFAEVALQHSLVYRVEQVFLFERQSGLLLHHLVNEDLGSEDPELFSAMLTAIQDFVRDSLEITEHDFLDSLRVGGLNLWVEVGPRAALALVIRGMAPESLRPRMHAALESVHMQLGDELDRFEGATEPFEAAAPLLAPCLTTKVADAAPGRRYPVILAAAGIALVVAVWAGYRWGQHGRWTDYVTRLDEAPGIVVVRAERDGGVYRISGLRDPSSADPLELAVASGLDPERIVAAWEPFQAQDPSLILARIERRLQPPDGVTVVLDGDLLEVEGVADEEWLAAARSRIPALAPLVEVRLDRLFSSGRLAEVEALRTAIEYVEIGFATASTELSPGGLRDVEMQAERLIELGGAVDTLGGIVTIEVLGHADATGVLEQNLALSERRAERVEAALIAAGVDASLVGSRGLGATPPGGAGAVGARDARRVSFVVRLVGLPVSEHDK